MRVTPTPIEPIRKRRQVALEPARAFALFTEDMHRWWPLDSHSIAGEAASGIRFEAKVGGRVIELTKDGREHSWADVIAWDPPHRFVLSWHPQTDPVAASVLEVVFEPTSGGTEVRLVHRGWEEFGDTAGLQLRSEYDHGWDIVLAPFERAGESAVAR